MCRKLAAAHPDRQASECRLRDSSDGQRLIPVPATAEGDDPSVPYGEDVEVAVVRVPSAVGVQTWSPNHHHHPVAISDDLLELRPEAPLVASPQCLLQLVATVTGLGLGVLEAGIEIGPLQVRIDE